MPHSATSLTMAVLTMVATTVSYTVFVAAIIATTRHGLTVGTAQHLLMAALIAAIAGWCAARALTLAEARSLLRPFAAGLVAIAAFAWGLAALFGPL